MKNKIIYICIICLVIISIAGLFYFLNNRTEKNTPADEGVKGEETSQTDTWTISTFGYVVPQTPPDIGFPTGLKQYPKLTWQEKVISSEKNYEDIDVKYPEFIGGSIVDKLNKHIYSLIESTINEDRERIGQDGTPFYHVQLAVEYNVVGADNGIVGVEVVTNDTTGGGNGNHEVSYQINWDLKSDRLLSPDELFCSKDWTSTLMPMARKLLLQYYDQSPDTAKPIDSDTIWLIENNTSTSSSNWQNLLLSKNGVIVVFPSYRILGGIFGIIRIYIPDSANPHFLCLP